MGNFDPADIVVAFDMDGTLLDADNNVIGGQGTVDALTRLSDAGCTMAIGTGRLDHDIICAGERFGLSFENRISQHGAVRVSKGRIEADLIDRQEAFDVLGLLDNMPVRVELNTVSNRYWLCDRDPSFPKELYDSHIIKNDYYDVVRCQPVVLFLVIGETAALEDIARRLKGVCVKTQAIMSSATSLEIMPRGVSKGEALTRMYPGKRIVAIGDAPNDFGMFAQAEKSYLVSDVACDLDVVRVLSIREALEDIWAHLAHAQVC